MVDTRAVKSDSKAVPQHDLAPMNGDQILTRASTEGGKALPVATEKFIDPSAGKRKKTKGEVLFDWTTYGAVAWLLNEAISTVVGISLLSKPENPNAGWLSKTHSSLHNGYTKSVNAVHEISPFQNHPAWTSRTMRILVLCVGGTLLVPVIKWLEDRKGKLVRKADAVLEGKKAELDPQIVAAHEDMDKAPKQTWRSLWEGRGVVMATAIGLDVLAGNDSSPTTKWLANTPFKNYSNMERAGSTLTRDALSLPFLNFSKSSREAVKHMRQTDPWGQPTAAEGKALKYGMMAGFVLILSGALTLLFYFSSKIFAKGQEKRSDAKETAKQPPAATGHAPYSEQLEKAEASGKDDTKKPATRVARVENLDRMAVQSAQPSMNGVG